MPFNSNPSLIGSNTALASPQFDDLYLPVFSGEVLQRYNEFLTASRFLRRKSISSGNTAKFPRMGGLGAERHARGAALLGMDTEQTDLAITLDDRPLISHFRLDDIDEAMLHFETRSELAMQAGQALAEAQDSLSIRLLINASRATPTSLYGGANSVFPGGGIDGQGTAVTSNALPATAQAAWTTGAAFALLVALDDITVRFDEMRVPTAMRNVLVPVRAWHALKNLGSPRSAADISGAASITVPPLFQDQQGWYGAQPNPSQFINPMLGFEAPLVYNGWAIWRSNLMPNGMNITTDEAKYHHGTYVGKERELRLAA